MLTALDIHQAAQALGRLGVPGLPRVLRKLIQVTHAAYIGNEATFGEGCELAYGGLGIVIHPKSRIGKRVLIGPHVTIGGRSSSRGAPIIEDDVNVGAGACLLGDIRIGRGARIGANAVVIRDVAPFTTVAGVPAREIRRAAKPGTPGRRTIPIRGEGDEAPSSLPIRKRGGAEPDPNGGRGDA